MFLISPLAEKDDGEGRAEAGGAEALGLLLHGLQGGSHDPLQGQVGSQVLTAKIWHCTKHDLITVAFRFQVLVSTDVAAMGVHTAGLNCGVSLGGKLKAL